MSRILLLLDDCRERDRLGHLLGASYQLLVSPDGGLEVPFDLCVLDGPTLARLAARLQARKAAAQPHFLPCLLVATPQDRALARAHLGQVVDELIFSPVEPLELEARVESLLHRRHLSTELERRVAERTAQLQESETRNRIIANLISDYAYIFQVLPDGTLRGEWVTESFTNTFGLTLEEVTARGGWQSLVLPEDLPIAREHARKVAGGQSDVCEMRWMTADGQVRWLRDYAQPVFDDSGQRVIRIFGASQDITERKHLEAQLLQAQRMESIGRLAGGVAHDFNNLLSVIILRAELALNRMPAHHPLSEDLFKILDTARLSADIVRQLLTFARQQPNAPQVLNLNEAVEAHLHMLGRLIGEQIELRWHPGQDLWPVRVDPAQIHQILSNLCLNARDAIVGDGRIVIETSNVVIDDAYCRWHPDAVPGEYVLLMVADNGMGMTPDILSRIFEPFFTTKEIGKGTGLGLATVYGIVKQYDGFIHVYSEPGQGSTFKIYLPRYRGDTLVEVRAEADVPQGNGEVILVVEDEPAVLDVVRALLEDLGYVVLAAGRPSEALKLAEDPNTHIDLLLSDMVMPEMGGPELAERLQALHPGLTVLFMSGYTSSLHGAPVRASDAKFPFLQKPFTIQTMAEAVHRALHPKGA
ncbi:ATP-binding protein [Litorilinea aerophila]|uniref:histidine kinase n=1 Tax=Litorilinea aerophila TaxID=1204385 RepID=A0A540VKK5_9CHLR|nr:hybrid sensor histidine kinase/response regulator [Litorilinea aerophila]